MKIEVPFLAALVPIGTSLMARMAAQGVEQALFSAAIEYGRDGVRAVKIPRLLPNRREEARFDVRKSDMVLPCVVGS